jgi:hypothetical protein
MPRKFNADKINNKNCMLRYALSDKYIFFVFTRFSELIIGLLDILNNKTRKY